MVRIICRMIPDSLLLHTSSCAPADLIDEGILLSKAMLHHHQIVHTQEALKHALKTSKENQNNGAASTNSMDF